MTSLLFAFSFTLFRHLITFCKVHREMKLFECVDVVVTAAEMFELKIPLFLLASNEKNVSKDGTYIVKSKR